MSSQLVDSSSAFDASSRSWSFDALVVADAAGEAAPEARTELEADPLRWRLALERLLDETEESLQSVRRLNGPERAQVVSDFEAERDRLARALALLTGEPVGAGAAAPVEPGVVQLQASWAPGQLVTWAAGLGCEPLGVDELRSWLAGAGATSDWVEHADVVVPGATNAPAVATPLRDVLGWLVALAGQPDPALAELGQTAPVQLGPSLRWLATVAAWAVEQVAQGRMVPQLSAAGGGARKGSDRGGWRSPDDGRRLDARPGRRPPPDPGRRRAPRGRGCGDRQPQRP